MKNQALSHVHIQMRKDHIASSSLVSCLLNWVQKQYCSVIKKKEKKAQAMNCSGGLSGPLNQTETLLKLTKSWYLIL